jgi:hypothetical protein
MNTEITFPVYRKSKTGSSLYRILSYYLMEEYQIVGTKVFYFEVHARQYPDMLRIREMITLTDGVSLPATDKEFGELSSKVNK